MADVTIEGLQAELEALRTEFREFRDYALPVIDNHQPLPKMTSDELPWPSTIKPEDVDAMTRGIPTGPNS